MFSKVQMPFSEDCSKYVSDLGNVTMYSIQLAYYMGYSTVYLYGMDNTYMQYLDNDGRFVVNLSVTSHADGIKKTIFDSHKDTTAKTKFQAFMQGGYADKRKSDLGYIKCREFADSNIFTIINLTHGGSLDFFDRKDFYDVFG